MPFRLASHDFEDGTPSRKKLGILSLRSSRGFLSFEVATCSDGVSTYIVGRYEREFCIGFF